ncbi:hypothetical protein LPB86_14875 [Pedobacter sp. MC2016-14]|uniref:toxin-antitoxin system YwqK family antitoxin n=1 Tax=Pedobacter sp. MC2016-14 TaxID=2897327 RepID=UPI001E646E93|nr:hypothetical protein [Pedobacter sp. MC2016-14]MCD0489523.1 hypothetical protein [Pedobacter sp. MC2016-14]
MRKNKFLTFAVLFALLVTVFFCVNEEFYYKILNRSGESYRLNSKGNFEGRSRVYRKGIKIFDGYFKDGKLEGWSFEYYDNGELKLKSFYKNDFIHGYEYEYYSDGKLKSKKYMIKGKWYADQLYYSEKGELTVYSVSDYRNMPNDFFYIIYSSSGSIKQVLGTLLSENIAICRNNSFKILEQGNSYKNIDDLYITVANPPKLKSTFKILVNKKEYSFTDIKTNTLKLKGAFKKVGKYTVIGMGTLKDNDKLIKRDTISVTFIKGT